MTYIELINAFWELSGRVDVTPIDTKFYFYLLHLSNRSQWTNPLQIRTIHLEASLQMSRKTITESRNRLKQLGLIDFIPGERTRSKSKPGTASYLIKNLPEKALPFLTETEEVTVEVTVEVTEEVTDIKTKTKKKENPLKGVKEKEPPTPLLEGLRKLRDEDPQSPYGVFLSWMERNTPYLASRQKTITRSEYESLTARFGQKRVGECLIQLNNRKDKRALYDNIAVAVGTWLSRDA